MRQVIAGAGTDWQRALIASVTLTGRGARANVHGMTIGPREVLFKQCK
jgi:hypothetical protein